MNYSQKQLYKKAQAKKGAEGDTSLQWSTGAGTSQNNNALLTKIVLSANKRQSPSLDNQMVQELNKTEKGEIVLEWIIVLLSRQ